MKKKSKLGLSIFMIIGAFYLFVQPTYALSGSIRVHYKDDARKPAYSSIKKYGENMGYNVYDYQDSDNSLVLFQLSSSDVFVIHNPGMAGLIQMGKTYDSAALNTYLSGKGGNGGTIKSVSSLEAGSLKNLKLAIYYGMDTGSVSSTYGDICQETVNKGAQAAVAWRGVMLIDEANEWNRLFFEKAQTDSIVEGFRHADYWLRYNMSADAAQRMGETNRNEKGNIYGIIHK